MSIERHFKHHYNVPHNDGRIDIEVHIEYESTNWTEDSTGDIDVIDAWVSRFKFVKHDITRPEPKAGEMVYERYPWHKAVMSDAEAESAQAWLDQIPLDYFQDAAFENECEEWNQPPLFLQL